VNVSPEQLHREFQDAFNRHDVEAVAALYEADAVMVGPNGPARGTDAIRELYRAVFANAPVIDLQTLGATSAGRLAMLHGRWTLRWAAPERAGMQSEGRNTEVIRQQDDGRWLFVIDNPAVPQ
jgi:uncharacterized protein (TIGR02246 family)